MAERYSSNSNPGKKKSWTNEEDAHLIKLVQKHGAQRWTVIAENLPGKSSHYSRSYRQTMQVKMAQPFESRHQKRRLGRVVGMAFVPVSLGFR
jgi:hypothetical protein